MGGRHVEAVLPPAHAPRDLERFVLDLFRKKTLDIFFYYLFFKFVPDLG